MAEKSEVLEEIREAHSILVIQGENPDGDSLATSLALEEILETAGKSVAMFCAVDIPKHLRFLEGWDRVTKDLPNTFDLTVVVDTASESLLERTFTPRNTPILRSKPLIIMDHHDADESMPFQTIAYIDTESSATGEVVHGLFDDTEFEVSVQSKKFMTTSILYDTRGLSTEATTPRTIRLIADFVEAGVNLAELDEARMLMNKRDLDIAHYKGELLQRVELRADLGLATVDITWEDIQAYSDRYNPAVLVLDEMRLINGVDIAIAYKTYPDGKILAKIRSNRAAPYANRLAEQFDGGGHPQAAGFKVRGRDFLEIKRSVEQSVKEFREQA